MGGLNLLHVVWTSGWLWGNTIRWFLFHLNVAPSWYCQTQSGLSKGSTCILMLRDFLKCKTNNRDLRKRNGLRNSTVSLYDVFSIFLADCNLPECVWPASTGLDLLRLWGRLSSPCSAVCSSCKRELCSAVFNRGGNILHLLNYIKD